jgi:nitrate reductase NapA
MTRNCKELANANYEAVAEMHPDDAKKLGVKDGDEVKLTSRRGEVVYPVRTTAGARPGLLFAHMHDPDRMCNRLTIDSVDQVSRQPEFKICAVKVEKA